MNHFQQFIKSSCDFFSLEESDFQNVSPHLISPFVLQLPKKILEQAENIVADLYTLTQNTHYQDFVAQKNSSVARSHLTPLLCSLDCHINDQGQLKIIEINTNASSYLINVMNYYSRGLKTFPNAIGDLASNFKETLAPEKTSDVLAIMDAHPREQKLFIEFLMYKKWIEKNIHPVCEILDPSELKLTADNELLWNQQRVSSIYNRHTDFFLDELPDIRKAYEAKTVRLSPGPWGYSLLAEKTRMVDMQKEDFKNVVDMDSLPHLKKALLKTIPFSHFNSVEDLWKERQHFFFKPADSFGSKSVYNGKSISRSKFDSIYSPDLIAQEAVRAPEVSFDQEGTVEKFKYDLRFFFYQNKVQLLSARLYRGQLTNLQTPNGGHAPVSLI
jgi:hypothetical protein